MSFLASVFKQTVAGQLYSIEFGELKLGEFVILNIVYMAQSCCNPFDIPGHTWSSRRKNLRPVTAWMCERAPHITIGMKICDTCRKKLSKESPDVTESVTSELDAPTPPSSQAIESRPLFSHSLEAVYSTIINMQLSFLLHFTKNVDICKINFLSLIKSSFLVFPFSF